MWVKGQKNTSCMQSSQDCSYDCMLIFLETGKANLVVAGKAFLP